jgi:5-methylcytosine-specific restriction enzyme A
MIACIKDGGLIAECNDYIDIGLGERMDLVQRHYNRLKSHGHRECEGRKRGDPLPFPIESLRILIRDALKSGCKYCGVPLGYDNLSIDHKRALSMGGTSELSNLQAICWNCNRDKGSLTAAY